MKKLLQLFHRKSIIAAIPTYIIQILKYGEWLINLKKRLSGLLLVILLLVMAEASGCSLERGKNSSKKEVDFTIVKSEDIPEQLKKQIDMKMKDEFDLTYSDGNNMYIVSGYGEVPTGGYSITVEELRMDSNKIHVRTKLHAPEESNDIVQEFSCPYIVIKLEDNDKKVVVNRY